MYFQSLSMSLWQSQKKELGICVPWLILQLEVCYLGEFLRMWKTKIIGEQRFFSVSDYNMLSKASL